MQRDIRKYLTDIAIHIDYIEDFLTGISDFNAYEQDRATQYAVERALGIIGEAANHTRRMDPTISISNLNQIIALRNMLIHAYDSINNAIIWTVIVNHLPTLKSETNALLNDLKDE